MKQGYLVRIEFLNGVIVEKKFASQDVNLFDRIWDYFLRKYKSGMIYDFYVEFGGQEVA